MSENVIIHYSAPTLAGIKIANLFGYPCATREEGLEDIREINRILTPKGIIAVPFCFQKGRILLYIYRPTLLEQILQSQEVIDFLEENGYHCTSVSSCIAQLCQKTRSAGVFPHEVGLFLGYPLEDVKGFISHHAKDCKCRGCWKVYGDEKKAQKCFLAYQKCAELYSRQYQAGKHLKDLAVAL